jgi:hypothetical protein
VVCTTVYANTAWVRMNNNATRYYTVTELFALVLPASWAVTLLLAGGVPTIFASARLKLAVRATLPIVALVFVGLAAGRPGPLIFVGPPIDDPLAINQDLPRILAEMPPDRPSIAVGDYFRTVPLVYTRLADQRTRETYAATDHWGPMRRTMQGLICSGRTFSLVCMGLPESDCVRTLRDWAGLDTVELSPTVRAEGALRSGGAFEVLDAEGGPTLNCGR